VGADMASLRGPGVAQVPIRRFYLGSNSLRVKAPLYTLSSNIFRCCTIHCTSMYTCPRITTRNNENRVEQGPGNQEGKGKKVASRPAAYLEYINTCVVISGMSDS